MSTTLPTEEDVLAVLILRACAPVVKNCDSTVQWRERVAYDQAVKDLPPELYQLAQRRAREHPSIESAIGETERRMEVEHAQASVMAAARLWDLHAPDGVQRLHAAVEHLRTMEGHLYAASFGAGE